MPVVAWGAGTAGLVAEWNFDEGQGRVARDSSGKGHHGDSGTHGESQRFDSFHCVVP